MRRLYERPPPWATRMLPRMRSRLRRRIAAARAAGHGRRFTRYSLGSVAAAATSQLTFVLLYGFGAGARVSSVLGFLAGVAPNYQLNRRWAWGRSGRSGLRREIAPYLLIALVSLVLTTLGTEQAEARIVELGLSRTEEVLLTWLAFAVVNGTLFIAKYLVLDRWLFARPDPATATGDPGDGGGEGDGDGHRPRRRSRSQVDSRTRA